jgi:hypothetical protein
MEKLSQAFEIAQYSDEKYHRSDGVKRLAESECAGFGETGARLGIENGAQVF